ncbi:MAG: ABC transporter substrate-binding protein [Firmicutes bacterium]|nr:ABC transporter substrate-binding protein [Bacillota bacterium]
MKTYKWLVVSLIMMLAVSLAATGCGKKETSDTIKVGVNYELSGEVAAYGTTAKDAILLAFDEINAAGGVLGKKIEAVVLDNKSDAAEALNVATKLITQEKVVAHLGPATTGATLNVVPVCTEYKVPLITNSATNPDVTVDPQTKETREYVFRTCFIDPPQAVVAAEFAVNQLGKKKMAVYYDNTNDYSKGLYQVFKEQVIALGGEIVAEEGYVKEDQEFRPTLTKFKQSGAELIYIPGYYEKVAKIISQARELGIDVPFLGADGWDSPDLVEVAGPEALNNTFFTNHYSPQDPSEKVQNFVKAYKERYGSIPASFSATAYDAAYLLADAIKRAGSTDTVAITKALAETKDFDGITGKFSFDEQHNPVKEVSIIEMVNGEQTLKTKITPKQ